MTSTVAADDAERQPSPPTSRVVRVVELLCATPEGALPLADIVRRTGMSRATAHAVLQQLTADGWTSRDDGDYRIGPALARLAGRIDTAFPLRRAATLAARDLAQHLETPVFVAMRDDDFIEVAEIIREPAYEWIRRGRRLRLRPPIAREFAAWAPPDDREAWIAAAPAAIRTRLGLALAAIRERGYTIERLAPEADQILDAIAPLRSSPIRDQIGDVLSQLIEIDYLPDELVGDSIGAATIAAPIRRDAAVIASLVVCTDATLPAAEVERIGAATIAAADRLTEVAP